MTDETLFHVIERADIHPSALNWNYKPPTENIGGTPFWRSLYIRSPKTRRFASGLTLAPDAVESRAPSKVRDPEVGWYAVWPMQPEMEPPLRTEGHILSTETYHDMFTPLDRHAIYQLNDNPFVDINQAGMGGASVCRLMARWMAQANPPHTDLYLHPEITRPLLSDAPSTWRDATFQVHFSNLTEPLHETCNPQMRWAPTMASGGAGWWEWVREHTDVDEGAVLESLMRPHLFDVHIEHHRRPDRTAVEDDGTQTVFVPWMDDLSE